MHPWLTNKEMRGTRRDVRLIGRRKRTQPIKKTNTTNKENKSGIYVLLHHIIRINCYISCVVAPHLLRWPEQKLSHPAQMTFVSVGNAWIKLKIIPVMSLRPLHQVSVGNYNVCYLEFTRILIKYISIWYVIVLELAAYGIGLTFFLWSLAKILGLGFDTKVTWEI